MRYNALLANPKGPCPIIITSSVRVTSVTSVTSVTRLRSRLRSPRPTAVHGTKDDPAPQPQVTQPHSPALKGERRARTKTNEKANNQLQRREVVLQSCWSAVASMLPTYSAGAHDVADVATPHIHGTSQATAQSETVKQTRVIDLDRLSVRDLFLFSTCMRLASIIRDDVPAPACTTPDAIHDATVHVLHAYDILSKGVSDKDVREFLMAYLARPFQADPHGPCGDDASISA